MSTHPEPPEHRYATPPLALGRIPHDTFALKDAIPLFESKPLGDPTICGLYKRQGHASGGAKTARTPRTMPGTWDSKLSQPSGKLNFFRKAQPPVEIPKPRRVVQRRPSTTSAADDQELDWTGPFKLPEQKPIPVRRPHPATVATNQQKGNRSRPSSALRPQAAPRPPNAHERAVLSAEVFVSSSLPHEEEVVIEEDSEHFQQTAEHFQQTAEHFQQTAVTFQSVNLGQLVAPNSIEFEPCTKEGQMCDPSRCLSMQEHDKQVAERVATVTAIFKERLTSQAQLFQKQGEQQNKKQQKQMEESLAAVVTTYQEKLRHLQQDCTESKNQLRELTIDPLEFETLQRRCHKFEQQLLEAKDEAASQSLRAETSQKQLVQERHEHVRTKRNLDRAKQITDGEIERRKDVEKKLKELQNSKSNTLTAHHGRASSQGLQGGAGGAARRAISRSSYDAKPTATPRCNTEPPEDYAAAMIYKNPAPKKNPVSNAKRTPTTSQQPAPATAAALEPAVATRLNNDFDRADANRDGKLSLNEFSVAVANRDSASIEELSRAGPPIVPPAGLSAAAAQELRGSEAMRQKEETEQSIAQQEKVKESFEYADVDKDGFISRDEFVAAESDMLAAEAALEAAIEEGDPAAIAEAEVVVEKKKVKRKVRAKASVARRGKLDGDVVPTVQTGMLLNASESLERSKSEMDNCMANLMAATAQEPTETNEEHQKRVQELIRQKEEVEQRIAHRESLEHEPLAELEDWSFAAESDEEKSQPQVAASPVALKPQAPAEQPKRQPKPQAEVTSRTSSVTVETVDMGVYVTRKEMEQAVKKELSEQRTFFSVERKNYDKKLKDAVQLQEKAEQEKVEVENQLVSVRKEMVRLNADKLRRRITLLEEQLQEMDERRQESVERAAMATEEVLGLKRQLHADASEFKKTLQRQFGASLTALQAQFTSVLNATEMLLKVDSQIGHDLTCNFCLNTVEEPRMLVCGHSGCAECIEASAKASGDGYCRCPECDQFCRAGDDTFANHMVSAIAAKYMFRRQHHDTRDLMRVLKKLKGDFNNAVLWRLTESKP